MKTTRLIHALWVAALAIGFAGCASDNEPTSAAGKDADSPKELTFTAGTPDDGSAQSRVAYEDTERKLTWQADDKLLMAVFDADGYKESKEYTYIGTPGATSGDFTGDAVAGATTYSAYYPHTVKLDADGANPTLSMDVQKQSANDNTDHLKDHMLLQAINVTPDVPFSLTMKSSIMKFDLKNIPEDVGNLRSLIWAVKSSGNGEKYLVLNFPEGVVSFGSGKSTLTAYLGFMPQEMSMGSKGKFTVTLMGDKTYRRQIDVSSGMNYEEGKRYTAEIDGSWEPMAHMTFTTRVTTAGKKYFPFAYTTVPAPADMVIDWGKNEKPLFVSSGVRVSSHEYQYTGDYTITIYSAQTNATEQQIPTLAFKETDLLSVATPLLNTGTSNLGSLFYGCTKLASLPQGLFDNHPNVWSFQSTFNGCRALTSLPDGLFNKNKEVTTFNACFQGCDKLESLPIGLFDQNTKVKSFTSCFTGCSSLTKLPEGLFAKNMEAYDFSDCFMGCSTLTLNKLIFSSNQEDTERFKDVADAMNFQNCFFNVGKNIVNAGEAPTLWLYKTGGKIWTTTNCFFGATKLSNYDKIPTAWGGKK